ncbi:MAG: DNA recombination protein RmuC [Planctomycetota bacterium]
MVEFLLAVVAALLLASLVTVAFLFQALRASRTQTNETQAQLADRETAIEAYLDTLDDEKSKRAELEKQLAVAKQAEADFADRMTQSEARFAVALRESKESAHAAFKALASDALKQTTDQFLQLAEEKLAGEKKNATAQLDQRKVEIAALVKPIAEKLEQANRMVGDLDKSRREDHGRLREQLAAMLTDQRQLRAETANLVKALRRPEVRGQWGELQLRRVAELAGMADHCDFTEQTGVSATLDSGALRPDMIVSLPGGREIVVDAKTPIAAFIDAAESTEDEQREANLTRHVKHIEDKVSELSSKRYQDHFHAADFVVLFIPGESFLYAAAQRKPDLIESALSKQVVIATPTTLISLLKVVALGWREERLAENARRIQELGVELHKRVATATSHLNNLGKAVGKTVEHYNKFVTSFESRVVTQAKRFEELDAGSPGKELPSAGEITIVESAPREPRLMADSAEQG